MTPTQELEDIFSPRPQIHAVHRPRRHSLDTSEEVRQVRGPDHIQLARFAYAITSDGVQVHHPCTIQEAQEIKPTSYKGEPFVLQSPPIAECSEPSLYTPRENKPENTCDEVDLTRSKSADYPSHSPTVFSSSKSFLGKLHESKPGDNVDDIKATNPKSERPPPLPPRNLERPQPVLENPQEKNSRNNQLRLLFQRRNKRLSKIILGLPIPIATKVPTPSLSSAFQRVKKIGFDGSEGSCDLVVERGKRQVLAVKTVRHPRMALGKPIEACILQHILPSPHENIIEMFRCDFFANVPLVKYYIAYCSGGDLHELVRQYDCHHALLPERFIIKVFSQLLGALEHLHRGFDRHCEPSRLGIVHRDVKPENCFLRLTHKKDEYPDIVLGDFGNATFDFATYDPAGTASSWPPELPRKSPKGDVWGAGSVIHHLVHFDLPLAALPEHIPDTKENWEDWYGKAIARLPRRDVPEPYSRDLIELMLMALEMDHNKRKSASFLLDLVRDYIDERYPPTYHLYEQFVPLETWSFDMTNYADGAGEAAESGDDHQSGSTGAAQYFDMMDLIEGCD